MLGWVAPVPRHPNPFLNCLPKSGSEYIWDVLCAALGKRRFQPTAGPFTIQLLIAKQLTAEAQGEAVIRCHLAPHPYNVAQLDHHIPRWVLHVRDPRQATYSLYRAVTDGIGVQDPATHQYFGWDDEFKALPETERLNRFYRQILPEMVTWIDGWVAVCDRGAARSRVLISSFEEFKRDPGAFFRRLLAFYEVDQALALPKPEAAVRNFRTGTVAEWRAALSDELVAWADAQVPRAMRERFGWAESG